MFDEYIKLADTNSLRGDAKIYKLPAGNVKGRCG